MPDIHRLVAPSFPVPTPSVVETPPDIEVHQAWGPPPLRHENAPGGLAAFHAFRGNRVARQAAMATAAASSPIAPAPVAEDVHAAAAALRPLRAWLRHHAMQEGNDSRTVLAGADADAVARALLNDLNGPAGHLHRAVFASRGMLAARPPGHGLHLTADQARTLDRAMSALEGGRP
jgi:hypothetical protein